jgi:hypothetical protein
MKRKIKFVSSYGVVRAFWHKANDAQVAHHHGTEG